MSTQPPNCLLALDIPSGHGLRWTSEIGHITRVGVIALSAMLVTSSATFGYDDYLSQASSALAVHLKAPLFDTRTNDGFSARTDGTRATFENQLTFSDTDVPPPNMYATATGSVFGAAIARTAGLGVSWTGAVVATEIDPRGGAEVSASGIVSARWDDTVTVHRKDFPAGKSFLIKALAIVDGDFAVNFTNDLSPGRGSSVKAALKISGTGVPPGPLLNGNWGYFEDNDEHFLPVTQPVDLIELAIPATNGVPLAFSFNMTLEGTAEAYSNVQDSGSAGAMSAFFDVDFSRTLKWGGITGVYDADTGDLVEGWTITSASGFDYSKPFVAPEPASAALFGIGVCVLSALGMNRPHQRRKRLA